MTPNNITILLCQRFIMIESSFFHIIIADNFAIIKMKFKLKWHEMKCNYFPSLYIKKIILSFFKKTKKERKERRKGKKKKIEKTTHRAHNSSCCINSFSYSIFQSSTKIKPSCQTCWRTRGNLRGDELFLG